MEMASVTSATVSSATGVGRCRRRCRQSDGVGDVASDGVVGDGVGDVGDGVVGDGVGDVGDGVVGDGVGDVGDGVVGDWRR